MYIYICIYIFIKQISVHIKSFMKQDNSIHLTTWDALQFSLFYPILLLLLKNYMYMLVRQLFCSYPSV